MKKTYQFLVVLAAMLLGAMNVSAEEISLQDVPFWAHESGWGLEASKTTQAECAWVIGEATGQPYGDSNVNAFADLSGYDKLVVVVTEGTPRFLFNRDQDDGQYNSDEAQSHLIDNTKNGWEAKYFSNEGGTWTVDLKKMTNEKGYAYLHAIKGANWQDVTVESMTLVRQGKEKQVGWVNILTNSTLDESDDVSSFITVLNGDNGDGDVTYPAVIEDGAGVDGTRGIAIQSMENAPQTWSTQLFVHLPEVLPVGTEWRFSMDVMSDPGANVSVAAHAQPRSWQDGGSAISSDFADGFSTSPSWTTVTAKGTMSQSLFDKKFQSICFDLNNDQTTATQYYFDNIKFEIYKYGTTAEFLDDNVQIDFGFETNIAELCAGKKRYLFPNDMATVKINDKAVAITSVEGYADGRFYIFLEEVADAKDKVQVILNNASGLLKYAGGPNAGQNVPSVDEIADYNGDLTNTDENDVYPYTMLPPTIIAAKPEQGSFNIDPAIKAFTVKFDKAANAAKIKATLDGKALTVAPADGLVEEITLNYAGDNLANGLHSINITKVYPEDESLGDEVFTDSTYQFSVGAPDPSDVAVELIPASYFNTCANGSVPEGFLLYADGMEERVAGGSYGSGSRLFNDFAAGGDFTSALYMRSNYLTYGLNDDEHKLTMEAGKTYTLSFNTARWKSSGEFLKVMILNLDGEALFEQTVSCNPDVNGTKNAVKNSSAYTIEFTPATSGDYELRFVVANNADGEEAGDTWHELLLANVKFGYIPSSFGVTEMMAVNEALEKAQKIQETYADERYDGATQTALNDAISSVEAAKTGYTSPSECNAAVELLGKTSEAQTNHANACNDYDNIIKSGADVVRQNADNKFTTLKLYADLVTVVDKYHGVSVMQNDGTEEEPNWQKHYTFDILKDDAQLKTAISELTDIVNETQKMFTSGVPSSGTYGVAALVERLRLGAEGLKALGVAEDDYLVVNALNALDDNDELAEELKTRTKIELYAQLKEADNTLFAPNEDTGETPKYDMTVFVKNPNIYAREFTKDIEGWDKISGNAQAWSSWDGNVSHSDKTAYPEDCQFHPGWHAKASVEQTIYDLPAGVYTISYDFWDNSDNGDGSYGYVKLSDTPAVEEEAEMDIDVNTAGYALMESKKVGEITDIVVTDGFLTIGAAWGGESQAFMNGVKIQLTAPLTGYDYATAYTTRIDKAEGAATIRAIELFDLNGQRLPAAKKGVVILKKHMSDGTTIVEKVVK